MSFELLNARIVALQQTTKHASILIERLQNLDFQPGSVPLNIDIADVQQEGNIIYELSQEIREVLREETETLEDLKDEAAEFPNGKAGSRNALLKESLEQQISVAQRKLKETNTLFYAAIEKAKQSLVDAQQVEKEILAIELSTPEPSLSTTSTPPTSPTYHSLRTKREPMTAEEKEVAASSDVTAALRRTHNLMLSELSRSQFANQTLEESTAALAELSEKYSTLDTLLAGSRNLLGSLLRTQKSDTWYLETAFGILVATICWLVFRRFIYGPAWYLLWLPIKYVYKILIWTFVTLGIASAGGAGSGVAGTETLVQNGRPSLTIHNQATRALKVEGQVGGGRPPIINVGGGGKGAPMRNKQPGQVQEQKQEDSNMIEEVGKIIDGNEEDSLNPNNQEGIASEGKAEVLEGDGQEEIIPNPKKRMFEADVEDKKEEQRRKDEL